MLLITFSITDLNLSQKYEADTMNHCMHPILGGAPKPLVFDAAYPLNDPIFVPLGLGSTAVIPKGAACQLTQVGDNVTIHVKYQP